MIFCVEDDSAVRDLMIYALQSAGLESRGFTEGKTFFEALKTEKPQLILLEATLAGEDGLALLKRLKDQPETAGIPVIMTTTRGTEYDKVIGLDLGADDYLVNPFGMMEMISRVKAVLRRTSPRKEPEILRFGELELNREAHTVTVEGQQAGLTLKEFKLLRLFMEHPGRVYTREQLLQNIWGADYIGESRTVDVHIGTLRAKIGAYGDAIKTVRGVGYRMEIK